MLKKKLTSVKNNNNDPQKFLYVFKHGIIVYPISEFEYKSRGGFKHYNCIKNNLWYIEVNNNGIITTYQKKIKSSEIDNAIFGVVNHFYKLLTEK